MVRILGFHPRDPGSTPGRGTFFFKVENFQSLIYLVGPLTIVSTGACTVTSGSMAHLIWFYLLARAVDPLSSSRVQSSLLLRRRTQ